MLLSSTFHRVKTASTSYKLLMRYGSPIRTFKAHGGPNKAKHQTGAKLCGSKHSIVGRFKERLIRISRPWPEKTITVGRQLGKIPIQALSPSSSVFNDDLICMCRSICLDGDGSVGPCGCSL